MRWNLERELHRLAAAQWGLVRRGQLDDLGVGRCVVRRAVQTGAWSWLNRRVLKVASGPTTRDQLELGALLAAGDGAALSHATAARRLGLDVPRTAEVHVVVPASRAVAPLRGVRIWRSRDLRPDDVLQRGPVRQTRLGRTVVDLAPLLDDAWLRAVVDSAVRLRPSNRQWMELALEQHGQGRPGAERLRRALDALDHAGEPGDSPLDSFAMELGLATGRKPRLHHRVLTALGALEVDLAWPEVHLAAEFDGYGAHCSRPAFARDRERDRALVSTGWTVLRYVWADATAHRQRTIDELAAAWRRCAPSRHAG